MHITRIKATGVKGRTFDLALGTITAITGLNRSGKTTIKDALFLALFGHHPDLPKTNPGIMTLANGPSMSTAATFSTGEMVSRSWSAGKGGKISAESQGTSPFDDLAPFVPANFLGLGQTARTAYLATRGNPAEIRSALEAAFSNDDRVMEIYDSHTDPLGALDAIESDLVERRRATKQESTRLKAAIKEASANPVDITPETEAAGAAFEAIRRERTEKQGTLQALKKRARELQQERDAIESAWRSAGMDPSETHIPPMDPQDLAEIMTLTDKKGRASASERKRARLRCEVDEMVESFLDSETRAEIEETANDLFANNDPIAAKDRVVAARAYHQAQKEKAVALQRDLDHCIEREKAAIEARAKSETDRKCPTCGHTLTDTEIEALHGEAVRTATENRQEAARQLEIQIRARDLAFDDLNSAATVADRIERALKAREQLALERKAREKHQEIKAELAELEGYEFSESDETRLATLVLRRDARARFETLPPPFTKDLELNQAIEDATDLSAEIDALYSREANAERANRQVRERASYLEGLARMTTDLEAAEKAQEKAEAAVTTLVEAKRAVLATVWEPVVAVANRVLQATYQSGGIECRTTDTDLGLDDGAGFRAFNVLSGSEQAVLSFALAIGLATRAPARIAVVDELQRLDDYAATGFLRIAAELVKDGTVDQVIVLGHRLPAAKDLPADTVVIPC